MTALEQLQSIQNEKYVSEDGDEYQIELKPGLTDLEIDRMAALLPTAQIPAEIRDLLKFTSGFYFHGVHEVTLDGAEQFGFESIFPHSVQLAGDGAGNFWILDVEKNGGWGSVYFVCHDPAVVVLQAASLAEFLEQIDEFGKKGAASHLEIVQERTVLDIWAGEGGFVDIHLGRTSEDKTLREFASRLPDHFVIADLRNQPNGAGFAWGKFGPSGIDKAIRHETELLWGLERQAKKKEISTEKPAKKGFWAKFFGR